MLCTDVQRALAAQTGGDSSYDASTTLRMLPCTSQCKDAKVSVSASI